VLRELPLPDDPRIIVGYQTGDDAGVYRLTDELATVHTVDFFTPIVDDAEMFGSIAAANALSDVYAMGGTPLTALNILCYPVSERGTDEVEAILRGALARVRESGAHLIGGHSVDDPEPKFGMAVTGLIRPNEVATNAGARVGDRIVLTKPLGTGIVTTAAKYDACQESELAEACRWMAMLNRGAAEAMRAIGIGPDRPVHAATDITGFGLLGHLYRLGCASKVSISLDSAALPVLDGAVRLAASGYVTRGDEETRHHLGAALRIGGTVAPELVSIALDPQTSGGLAIVVDDSSVSGLLMELDRRGIIGYPIGEVGSGASTIVELR